MSFNQQGENGWSRGRFVAGGGSVRYWYFGDNIASNVYPRTDSNSGEQFLFEGMFSWFRGSPIETGSDYVRFSNFDARQRDKVVAVIAGKGMGQYSALRPCDKRHVRKGRVAVGITRYRRGHWVNVGIRQSLCCNERQSRNS